MSPRTCSNRYNVTSTRSDPPGLLQIGQRIGASIGIAAAGSVFFSTLRGHGSFADAYRNGIVVTAGLTAAALLLALIDRRRVTTRRAAG